MHCIMRRAAVVAAILIALQTPAAAGWKRMTLGQGGQYNSIAVDADGHPHISYLAGSNPNFKLNYAFFNGKSWRRETVDTGNVGLYNAIALDSQGHPHIAYAGLGQASMLKYAAFDGTDWTITTVDSGGYSAAIVMDANDHPYISYATSVVPQNAALRCAHHDGSNWIIETAADSPYYFMGTSIALNSAGAAYISYSDVNSNVDMATNASGSWIATGVDSGRQSSLALDNAGRPRIFYVSNTAAATKYAVWTGVAWSFTTLPYGDATSLALDGSDRPHVSFGTYTGNQLALTYGTDPGSGFVGVTLSGLDTDHVQTSIALDALGLPHITSAKRTANNNSTMRYAQLQLPDLGGGFTNISRTPLMNGTAVTATLEVFNLGNLNARAVSVRFYLSDNAVLDAGDTPIGPPRNIGAIGPGKTKLVNFNHTFPMQVAGTRLFAVLDAAEKNVEIYETNNTLFGVIP